MLEGGAVGKNTPLIEGKLWFSCPCLGSQMLLVYETGGSLQYSEPVVETLQNGWELRLADQFSAHTWTSCLQFVDDLSEKY